MFARRLQNIALQNVKVFSQTRLAFDNTVLEEGSGVSNASGLAVDDAGGLYLTDAAENRIYRWNAADRKADMLATTTGPAPQVLGFVPPSHLLAVAMLARPQ